MTQVPCGHNAQRTTSSASAKEIEHVLPNSTAAFANNEAVAGFRKAKREDSRYFDKSYFVRDPDSRTIKVDITSHHKVTYCI